MPKLYQEHHYQRNMRWKPENSRIRRDQVTGVHDKDVEQEKENIRGLNLTKELQYKQAK